MKLTTLFFMPFMLLLLGCPETVEEPPVLEPMEEPAEPAEEPWEEPAEVEEEELPAY